MDDERFITSTKTADDGELDVTLRPKVLADYVGQEKVKSNLNVFIQASKKRHGIFSPAVFPFSCRSLD